MLKLYKHNYLVWELHFKDRCYADPALEHLSFQHVSEVSELEVEFELIFSDVIRDDDVVFLKAMMLLA